MAGVPALLLRQNRELAALGTEHAQSFLRLLTGMKESLVGRLDSVARSSDPLDVWRLRAAIAEADSGIRTLTSKAVSQYRSITSDVVDLSLDHLGDEVKAIEASGLVGPTFSIDALKVLSDPTQELLAEQYGASVERYGSDLLQGVRQQLFTGFRAGDSFGDVTSSIAGQRGPFGAVGRANAERLVRTETQQAYGVAHHSGLEQIAEEVPAVRRRWVHIGSYPCDYCESLDGTKRSMDATWTVKMGKRSRTVLHPPLHPNCVCRVVIDRRNEPS